MEMVNKIFFLNNLNIYRHCPHEIRIDRKCTLCLMVSRSSEIILIRTIIQLINQNLKMYFPSGMVFFLW